MSSSSPNKENKNKNIRNGVKVVIRMRPPIRDTEISHHETIQLEEDTVVLSNTSNNKHNKTRRTFDFHHVWGPTTTNQDMMDKCIQHDVVDKFLNQGGQCGLFAYGFTGTGKSYSLFGDGKSTSSSSMGIIEASVASILSTISCSSSSSTATQTNNNVGPPTNIRLRVSLVELSGKKITDLLHDDNDEEDSDDDDDDDDSATLKIRADSSGGMSLRQEKNGNFVSSRIIQSLEEFQQQVLHVARTKRKVGMSTISDVSSRSHAVIMMDIISDELLQAEMKVEHQEKNVRDVSNDKDDALKEKLLRAYKECEPSDFEPGTELYKLQQDLGMPVEEAMHDLDEAREELEKVKDTHAILRGNLYFIDMAGNDWEKGIHVQSTISRQEQAAINKSLLAVKECLRAMASRGGGAGSNNKNNRPTRIPFRNDALTKVLYNLFVTNSTPDPSSVIMLATISPPMNDDADNARVHRQTANTLGYARLLVAK